MPLSNFFFSLSLNVAKHTNVWSYRIIADVVVAPPFIYIDQVKNSLTDRIEVSAQNVWVGKGGAYTGEIRLVTG